MPQVNNTSTRRVWVIVLVTIGAAAIVVFLILAREWATPPRHSDNWQRETCEKHPIFRFDASVCGAEHNGRGSTTMLSCNPHALHADWIKELTAGRIEKGEAPGVPGVSYFKGRSPAFNESNLLVFVWGENDRPKFISCSQITLRERDVSGASNCEAYYQLRSGVTVTHTFLGSPTLASIVGVVDRCFIPMLDGPFQTVAPFLRKK